ncbi:NADH-quinone oxidoreductase subunit M [Arcanobacterium hippocoleae]|uniref:NADH-quinone oxidoreductase subunit M n=1 Tax=Arcanobacterium hippocoleae TaxID=149017 RepID=A0ABU1T1P1_9ACTO|nr:NADH-quinone oxidoreductase subunit M [Arcanobacterium hippocoleae]MDR6939273.1 NADH-quinone oxidoreductase subunit M [Arcanobacterium hippocoleae]
MQSATPALPWLSILILLPLLGALIIALVKPFAKTAKLIALVCSILVFAVFSAVIFGSFNFADPGSVQLIEKYAWIPQIGASLAWGVNGMGLVMIALATFLVPLVIGASWNDLDKAQERGYFAWILALESIMIALFAARDIFLFYILFEAMIVPMYFLIGNYGGKERKHAAMKFLLYSLFGGLIMLLGVIAIFLEGPGGPGGYHLEILIDGLNLPAQTQLWIFVAFFIAFAIKAPMWPVHTWLPDTTAQATAGTSTLLVGVLDKLGTYGMIAICLPLFPAAAKQAAPIIIALAIISILWGALMAIGSDNLYRLVAYTSVSHFGFIVLGIFSGSALAITGAILYMVAHGVGTAGLFLIVRFLELRGGSPAISAYGGWQRVTPVLAGIFLVVGLATIALPGLSGFVPEYLVLMGTYAVAPVPAIFAVIGVVLAAVYILLPYQRIFTGAQPQQQVSDLNLREKTVMGILIAAMLMLGFYPQPVITVIDPVAAQTASVFSMNPGAVQEDPALETPESSEGANK